MAKVVNPHYFTFGIPVFNTAHKFVYMNDLLNTANNSPWIAALKENLYASASEMAASIGAEIGASDSSTIQSALNFLNNTANSERAKELAVIKEYRNTLKKALPNNKKLNIFLQKLDAGALNNPQDLTSFYIELTDYLNVIRSSVKDFHIRLNNLKKHNTIKMEDLAKDDYRFRAAGDTQALLNNITGRATRAQERIVESYASKIRQAAKDYAINSGLIDMLSSGEDIAAAIAVVALDMQRKMQEEVDKNQLGDLTEISNEVFDSIVEQYNQANNQSQTNLQHAITDDETELRNILNAARTILNIQMVESKGARKYKDKLLEKRKRELSEEHNLHKQLIKQFKNNSAVQELKYIEFNVGAKSTAHGNLFELINIINDGNSIKVRGATGTDILHLGSIFVDMNTPDIKTQLMPALSQIESILTKYEQKQRDNRFDERTQQEIIMNNEIQAVIDELDKQVKALNLPIQNLFVYHESLKLYKSAETDEMSGFHGRDLTIMHYLDKMYSANGLADLVLPQRDALDFLALNISNLAVGGPLKDTLENYLSIFAGLIMFDDIRIIAENAAQQLANQSLGITKQIHLYNLNGVYVPASMLLSFTYEGMKEISQQVINGQAARATISTAAAEDTIKNYLANRPLPIIAQWQTVAESVASNTKIRVTILAAFNEFLKSLGV